MTPLWWLVDKLSQALDTDERNAVRGDFAESGVTAGQALRDLLGLIARRQAALWRDWRPWLALIAIILPLATVLSLGSKMAAHRSATPIMMYVSDWTMAHLESPGARKELIANSKEVSTEYLILAAWAWSTGFVLGSVSRRTVPVNGMLSCLVVLFPGLVHVLFAAWYNPSSGLSRTFFYGAIFPLLVQAVLVLLPFVWGIRQGLQSVTVPGALRVILLVSAVTSIAALVIPNSAWVMCLVGGTPACKEWLVWAGFSRVTGAPQGLQIPTLPLALFGPLVYAVAMAAWRRWHCEPSVA